MKTDRFFAINIVDKCSRMFMLIFAGIILGAVLALAYYNIFSRQIGSTLILIAAYCVAFICYVTYTNAKRSAIKIEVFKDKLAFVFIKKHEISKRIVLEYSNIKSYKISAQSEKKTLNSSSANKNGYSLRVFGYNTKIETKDGQTIEFSDNSSDGVLIYSPAYVYRMLDVKRCVPDFPLILENFSSKKDAENFEYQFNYYDTTGETLSFFKNKKYMRCLFIYTFTFFVIAAIIAGAIAYPLYLGLQDAARVNMLLIFVAEILCAIVLPMWLIALFTSFFGGKCNRHAKNTIKEIITD